MNKILCVPGDSSSLEKVRNFVIEFAKEVGFKGDDLGSIELAVDEGVTNIIRHAYDEDPDIPEDKKVVEIELIKIDSGMEIRLRDNARPFNPRNVPLPDIEKHVRDGKTHGLGVFAMKIFMDEIEHNYYEGRGNEIILRKFIK